MIRLSFPALLAIALLLHAAPAPLHADAVGDAIARADRQAPREALQTLLAAGRAAPDRADLLAEISLSWSDCADLDEETKNEPAAKEAVKKAMEVAEKAVKADPNVARAHLAVAVACGKMTDYVDNSTKMALSKRIRDEAQRTIALNPKEPLAYEILGRWQYGIATLNPMLKLAARLAYGALPPASLGEAARYLEKAVELAPKRISPHHQLALVYKAQGQREKAAQQWKAVLALTAEDAEDREAQKEARAAVGKS